MPSKKARGEKAGPMASEHQHIPLAQLWRVTKAVPAPYATFSAEQHRGAGGYIPPSPKCMQPLPPFLYLATVAAEGGISTRSLSGTSCGLPSRAVPAVPLPLTQEQP